MLFLTRISSLCKIYVVAPRTITDTQAWSFIEEQFDNVLQWLISNFKYKHLIQSLQPFFVGMFTHCIHFEIVKQKFKINVDTIYVAEMQYSSPTSKKNYANCQAVEIRTLLRTVTVTVFHSNVRRKSVHEELCTIPE